jgi:copper transport protein
VPIVAAVAGFGASAVAIGLQGPYATGQSVGAFTDGSNWADVLRTRSGVAWAARAALFAVDAALVRLARVARRNSLWPMTMVLVLGGLVLAATYAGHGTLGRWPAVGTIATVVHIAAMAAWIGGLVVLLVVLRTNDEHIDHRTIALRFSMLAFVAVGAVALSGLVSGWRQIGSIHGLTSTTYGRLLLTKVAVVALVLAGAAASRRLLRHPVEGQQLAPPLRRTVGIEVVLAAVVLGLTSMLVATKPALAELGQPVDTTIVQGPRFASIQILPARQGRNTVHATIARQDGSLEKADEITVRATMPSRDVGPLVVPTKLLAANHVTSDDLQLPFTGTWQLEVLARYGETEQVRWVVTFRVG